jgi:hypothetical protein
VSRREYDVSIVLNHRRITKAIIDSHYEEKHAESISDDIILKLIKMLDGEEADLANEDYPFTYFVNDKMKLNGKLYRLVWLLEEGRSYIGIINAYRR